MDLTTDAALLSSFLLPFQMQEAVANVSDFPRLLEIIVSVAYSIVDAEKISVLILTDDKKQMTVFTSQDQMARNL